MRIKLLEWNVTDLNLSLPQDSEERENNSFNLSTEKWFPEDKDSKSFYVAFKLEIKDKNFDLSVHAKYHFELSEPITEEFKESTFPTVNAPAIAFPYLRAFVSNLTLQAGYLPIMLPSINFVEFAEK